MIKSNEKKINEIYDALEYKNIMKERATIYKMHCRYPDEELFYNEYKERIARYEPAQKRLKNNKYRECNSKDLANDYLNLESEKESLMAKYLEQNTIINELTQIKKKPTNILTIILVNNKFTHKKGDLFISLYNHQYFVEYSEFFFIIILKIIYPNKRKHKLSIVNKTIHDKERVYPANKSLVSLIPRVKGK